MQLFNLLHPEQKVSFVQAVKLGLGRDQGLFFPSKITPFDDISELLAQPLTIRSVEILSRIIGDEISRQDLTNIVESAFTFDAPLIKVEPNMYCLELFHGPTLAFKDFGGRFMAQCLAHISNDQPTTIITATSGDTGAAVAHAFYGIKNINVIILYPKGKVSRLQEKLFSTLSGNITTIAIKGDFDQCQHLVKMAFDDEQTRQDLHLNSANSINISRLLAQVCYYFEALAQLARGTETVISVPSGNFGNLTAGLIAKALGLPVAHFIAATNINDTVPRYLHSGVWQPNRTRATLSNAMDVSRPNNWPRVEAIFKHLHVDRSILSATSIDEQRTRTAMQSLATQNYVAEPHAAIAYEALKDKLKPEQVGIFLGTAHPAKFLESLQMVLGRGVELPDALSDCINKKSLSLSLPNNYQVLKETIYRIVNEQNSHPNFEKQRPTT